jgi:hypothetical protein
MAKVARLARGSEELLAAPFANPTLDLLVSHVATAKHAHTLTGLLRRLSRMQVQDSLPICTVRCKAHLHSQNSAHISKCIGCILIPD